MDIVICVALKDCYFLNKNLFFINKNLEHNNLYIITDKRNFKHIKIEKYPSIKLLDENLLIDGLSLSATKKIVDKYLSNRNYGWYFQQFLKLGFALSKYAKEDYLVWDADTVPLNPIKFVNANNQHLILTKKEHHKPYFNTIDNLFEAKKKASYSFISEHMVFKSEIVREMLKTIESNSNIIWYEQCIAARKDDVIQVFSEFETYGTYCLNYYPQLHCQRTFPTFRLGSKIYGIIASRKEIESLKFDLDTVSFEINNYPVSFYRRCIQRVLHLIYKLIMKGRIYIPNFPL